MHAQKILISIPEPLAIRMRATMSVRQRSKIIASLIETEVLRRERLLYEVAKAVENDDCLNAEMEDWNMTLQDGIKQTLSL